MDSLNKILLSDKTAVTDPLSIFDQLEPVDIQFMTGRWKGSELYTGHRMDGLLAVCGWYGKLFVDPDEVHPLLFYTRDHKSLFAVNPNLIPMWMTFPKIKILKKILLLSKPILQTMKPKAHLKMMDYRGKTSTAMIYNSKPIQDHFRKIDDNRVLGLMELKGDEKPYFFILERDMDILNIEI